MRLRTLGKYLVVATAGTLGYWSCGVTDRSEGEALARTHCGSCHLFPEPSLLPKKIWEESVLPHMALRLGLSQPGLDPLGALHYEEVERVTKANVFPKDPVLSEADWQKIVQYYRRAAPDSLGDTLRRVPAQVLTNFTVKPVESPLEAMVTAIRYDSLSRQLWVGQRGGAIHILDKNLRATDSLFRSRSPLSDFRNLPDGTRQLLNMGIMDPNDQATGEWVSLRKQQGTWRGRRLITGLQRPVHASFQDINEDGREDLVLCEYGNYTGRLSWYESTPGDSVERRIIENRPGARITYWHDYNGDGRKDLWVLWAQGDEQIAVYLNGGKGNFVKKVLLRFPPVYGSGYFELADFNADGHVDILYINGDNADLSHTLKPYHGLRIYLNDGKGTFTERYFYPLHGASQALARDFDGDGDLDIAAIAFFPDFSQKQVASFVYLENQGDYRFVPRTFADTNRGRWLTMEAADVDQDGDLDLLLGSFYLTVTPTPQAAKERWQREKKGVVLLENQRF